MLFGRSGQAVLALHERHSRLLIALRQKGKAADPIASAIEPGPWAPSRPSGAARWPSTTAPNSHVITGSMPWTSRPSSAIPIPLGRREAWRMPSAACAGCCPARRTWRS